MEKGNWVIIANATDPDNLEMIETIENFGGKIKVFNNYGNMRAFVRSSGLNENVPIAFRNGSYIGDLKRVKEYIELSDWASQSKIA